MSNWGGFSPTHPRLTLGPENAVVIAAGLVSLLIPFVMFGLPQRPVLIAFSLMPGVMLLFLVPIRWLPSVTLALFALLPVAVLPGNRITASFSPVLAAVAIWGIRCGRQPRLRDWPKATCAFLSVWLLLTTVTSIAHQPSALWAMNFIALILGVVWLASKTTADAARLLETSWMVLGVGLGALAFVENLLGRNPITFLSENYLLTQQYWSVYRVTTTLGTPLVNGTFFAVAFAIAWARLLSRASLLAGLCFFGAGGALLLTFSRSALIGGAAALAVVTIARSLTRRGAGLKLMAVLAVAVAFVVGYQAIQDRARSDEGVQSAELRSRVIDAATVTASLHQYLGSGPGTSHRAQLAAGTQVSNYSPRSGIENSYLQLLVSIGVPGLAATGLLIVGRIGSSFRRHAYTGLGALVAVAVSAAGYSMAEDAVPTLSLFGLAMLLGMAGSDQLPGETPQTGPERRAVEAGTSRAKLLHGQAEADQLSASAR